ncbi:MAG: cytochrome c3 family protein [Nitrospirota bacterium]
MGKITYVLFLTLLTPLLLSYSDAKVIGPCANCHTMHNSQNGGAVARDGAGVGWDSSGSLTGGSLQTAPQGTLLVASCVGCHSATYNQTIVQAGDSRIPIVFNTSGYPSQPLAAGNFYYVSIGGINNDLFGHNVYGISGADGNLAVAPGRQSGTCGNSTSCHVTLAVAADTGPTNLNNACEGCHTQVAHHDDSKPWYRFLKGHLNTTDYVTGIEDPDWEQAPTAAAHNWYKGYIGPVDSSFGLEQTHSISSYCGGCHGVFHRDEYITDAGAWLRHPTDILLPQTGEYSSYTPSTNYSPEAPVAWSDPANPAAGTAVVMCLSCHRAHGSQYADILRWDYQSMSAGTTGSAAGTGCFTCHTQKDGL